MRVRIRNSAAPLVAAAMGAGVVGRAGAQDVSREELAKQIAELRAQVERLEAAQQAQGQRLTAREVDATVDSVLADADRRSQVLQAQGLTAGYDKGKFFIQSQDGNFVLNPQLWFQARYVANYRAEDAANKIDGQPKTEDGFEIRRAKFIFEGNAFTKDFKYRFQFNTNRSTGNAFLEDGYVSYRFAPQWGVRLGQYKEPTFHEERTSDIRQLAAERSLVNFTLGGGNTERVQGIALFYDPGPDAPLRAEAGYTDGPNTKNTNFQDSGGAPLFGAANPDFGAYARADYKLFGDWKNYEDFTALGDTKDLLVVGGGASYAQAGDNTVLFHTADAQYEAGKLNVYGAYYGVYSDGGGQTGAGSLYDFGAVAQAGYLVTTKLEPFVRYEYINLDPGHGQVGDDNFHVFAVGANYYIKAHALKFTLDVSYLPNGSSVNADGLGILDPDANEEQFVLRGQFQLVL